MTGEILVLVRSAEEVELTRGLVSLLPQLPFKLLFGQEDLRTRFGATPLPTSCDLGRFFVESPTASLALCFSAGRELGPNANLLWLSFLRELGVPTVEIQRELLQDTDAAARESLAHEYWTWGGAQGIGALTRALAPARSTGVREDLVVISSRLDGGPYPEEERFRFVFAMLRLARETPDCTFLWRPAPSEQNTDATQYWGLLEKLAPANLVLEEHETLAQLLARSRFVIGMPATPMLDAVAAGTAGLLFEGKALPPGLGGLSGARFRDYSELRDLFGALRREPAAFALSCSLPQPSPEGLTQRLMQVALPGGAPPRGDALPLGLRYLAYYQESRGRADVSKANAALSALDKRLASLEQESERWQGQLVKALEPTGLLRRASVTHRALKLFDAVGKRALRKR